MFLYSTVSTLKPARQERDPQCANGWFANVSPSLPLRKRLTDSWDGSDNFSKLELVQNGRLTSSVEPNLCGEVNPVDVEERSLELPIACEIVSSNSLCNHCHLPSRSSFPSCQTSATALC
eukprot:365366-Chlamydomonas_euryale.AAC.5